MTTANIVLNLSGNWKESFRQVNEEADKINDAFGKIDDGLKQFSLAKWAQDAADQIKKSTSGLDDLRSAVEEVGDGLEALKGKQGAKIRDAILDNVNNPAERLKLFRKELEQELTGTGPAALRGLGPLNDALGRSAARFEGLKAKAGPAGEVAVNVLRSMGIEASSMATLISSAGLLAVGALGAIGVAAGGAALALGVGGLVTSVRAYIESSEDATERTELFEAQTTALKVSVGELAYDVLGLEDAISGLTFSLGIAVDEVEGLDKGTLLAADGVNDLFLEFLPLGDVLLSVKDLGGGVLDVFSAMSDEGDRLAQSIKGASDQYEDFNKQLERSIDLAAKANTQGGDAEKAAERAGQRREQGLRAATSLGANALPKRTGGGKRRPSVEPARNQASSLVAGAISFGDSNQEALADFYRTENELPFLIGDVRAPFEELAGVVAGQTSPGGNARRRAKAEGDALANLGFPDAGEFDKQIGRFKALGGVLDASKDAATGFGLALGDAFASLASGGATLDGFGSAIRGAFGSLWQDLGRGFVAQGIALGLAGDIGGGLALAGAGVALQTVAGLVSSKGGGGASGGIPSGASDVGRGAAAFGRDLRGGRADDREQAITLRVGDQDLRAWRRRKAADDARRGWGVAA